MKRFNIKLCIPIHSISFFLLLDLDQNVETFHKPLSTSETNSTWHKFSLKKGTKTVESSYPDHAYVLNN